MLLLGFMLVTEKETSVRGNDMIGSLFSEITSAAADLLFPSRCHICRAPMKETVTICGKCLRLLPFISGPVCRCCGMEFTAGEGRDHLCGQCLKQHPSFEKVVAFFHYEDPVKAVLHRLKFSGDTTGLAAVRRCVEESNVTLPEGMDLILPVPLHYKRLRMRGFNQSLLLARELFPKYKSIIRSDILQRSENTIPQTSLSREMRRENLASAFSVKNPEDVRGKRICLVDDIYTTGTTVEECSKILIKSGCKSVLVMVVARTPLW